MVKQGVSFVYGKSKAIVVLVEGEKCLISFSGKTTWIDKSIVKMKLESDKR